MERLMFNKTNTLSLKKTRTKSFLGLNTQQLFKNKTVVSIRHQGELYYLRLTKNNKVILTK